MRRMLLLVSITLGCSSPSHGHRADAGAHPNTAVRDAAAPLDAMDSAVLPKADGATSAAPTDGSVSHANLDGSTTIVPFDAAMDLASFDMLAWTAVAWAPTSCAVQVADDVSALQPLRWAQGTGSAAACSVLVIPGNASESARVHPAGGYQMTFMLASLPNTNLLSGTAVVLYDMQGNPKRAIRMAAYCTALYVQGESDGCWFFTYDDFQSQVEQGLGCGDVKAPTQTFNWTGGFTDPQVTDHVVFVHTASASQGLRFDRSQPTQPVSVPQLYSAETLGAHDTSVVAQMSYMTTGYEQPLYRLDSSASWQLLRDPKPRVVWALSTDDKNIAWVETDSAEGFEHRPGTFYLAPWPAPGAVLVPRSVRVITDIGRYEPFVLHHGYFAHAASSTVDLYRTSDGAHWSVPLPDGFHRMIYTGLWLDDSFVTYTVDLNNDAGASSARSLVRCPIASVAQGAGS